MKGNAMFQFKFGLILGLTSLVAFPLHAGDWPTQRHDYSRSGTTDEKLDPLHLREAWVYRSTFPPVQAWPGPARWDAYGQIPDLRSLRNFDPVFHVSAVGDAVYFGSSADDTVRCLNAATGETRWAFTAEGPIRIAPTVQNGKVYFGSDDGHAYCLSAADGKLLWKFAPSTDRSLVLNNGRLISFWPIRTGIVVSNGTAYFAASMLPWKKSYLSAIDAETGKVDGDSRFVREFANQTLEGAMVASTKHVIVPQGRVAPLAFERTTGKQLGVLQGIGSFLMLADDGQLFQGPGNRKGDIISNVPESKGKPASFQRGNSVVANATTAWVLDDHAISAVDRAKRQPRWRTIVPHASELLLAGDLLYVGARDEICALDSITGKKVWRHAVHGRAFGLAVANQRLFVSTDEGRVHCFRVDPSYAPKKANEHAIAIIPRAVTFDKLPALPIKDGPYVRYLGDDRAEIVWATYEAMPSVVEFGESAVEVIRTSKATTQHRIVVNGLRRERIYKYRIVGTNQASATFELDNGVNFTIPAVTGSWTSGDETRTTANFASRLITGLSDIGGIAVLVGSNAELAWQLTKQSSLRVVMLEKNAAAATKARTDLLKAGVYGGRVTVLQVDDFEKAPLPQCFANIVLLDRATAKSELPMSAKIAYSWVKPNSGELVASTFPLEDEEFKVALVNQFRALNEKSVRVYNAAEKGHVMVMRPPLPGVGEWTHMFGQANNTAYSGETLQGRASASDLEVQWLGMPGPRFNIDRNPRKPGPLAVNGRLFVQGMGRIAAMDAYNGTILWTVEVPRLQRYNLLRDASNWCADASTIYLAHDQQCIALDAKTGQVKPVAFDLGKILPDEKNLAFEWGYLARVGEHLLGSTVEKESAYKQFWGNKNWYDEKAGDNNRIVCADRFFAVDPKDGSQKWVYTGGAVLHPSICIEAGKAYFVESRNPDLKKKSGRLGLEIFKDMRLVALDLATGREEWSQAIHPLQGKASFSMATSGGKIVIVSSEAGRFGIYSYDAKNGAPLWDKTLKWEADHHGKHLSRPAIVGNKLIVRPYVMNLDTGATLSQAFPKGHTCATYCVTEKTLIFRAGELTMWNLDTKQETRWPRLRPDCLLSTIAAQGMVLSPEGGGGCSCGIWLEISIGFMPTMKK